ncbi:MAG: pyruvate:ferredoxin (flavodoxin) oxidoreductase [Myxococcota bacterium]|jgi:pyruvate-ferredoxin/flavodoxin oxidoreductase|nr:pyruvate:ferredoxin (flavodoxin) oxidoreductase [Myxococcota bacterium]
MSKHTVTIDGIEAAAHSAFLTNEVIAIYPITPASGMGELSDAWAADGMTNIWGTVPDVCELQSEGGAAGAVHGSLQAGALTCTFTASQGLLLKIPNMYKIAGELTPSVFHIAARSLASHALSIFGDHSDVMACRGTGFQMLAASSVQEVQDMAMIAQMAALESRVPVLHFFDGFRTSHEVNKIELLSREDARALINEDHVIAHRSRAMNPENPVLRGTAQNPDVFFQAREACNPYYDAAAGIMQKSMDAFAAHTGRQYHLFDYVGAPDAERLIILMGSGVGAAREAVAALNAKGEKVGIIVVHLYRPFDVNAFVKAIPSTVKRIAVLDRTKEPGATGEPLYLDVVATLQEFWGEHHQTPMPRTVGGRYGLSSKEFTPAMVAGVFSNLSADKPRNHFTVGIEDDVTHLSLPYDHDFITEAADTTRALFYGLGSDGTVGANKNSVKIIGENTDLYSQGYFVYDSKKAGAVTVSHLRFGPRVISSTYLIQRANFVACHQFNFLERMDMLEYAEPGATFLLNSPYTVNEVWQHIPRETQQQIIDKKLRVFVIDASRVAEEVGMGNRINTIMQTCFFKLSGVLPADEAIEKIKDAIKKTYSKRGESVVQKNYRAVDATLANLFQLTIPNELGDLRRSAFASEEAPAFVRDVVSVILSGKGDTLPVSALPVDGTFPTATTRWEKRSIAREIPIWDPEVCIACGICSVVCPHAAQRIKTFKPEDLSNAPASFLHTRWRGSDLPEGTRVAVQVAPDDCTGCGVCVEQCPAKNKQQVGRKAINMEYKLEHLEREREKYAYFETLPWIDRAAVAKDSVKTSQLLQPTFEFSGACAGCGETPYVKLVSQLFGDRMLVANATGCSSIYGGNLPATPWATDAFGRGPSWNNSLFEDNAEFGLGMRLALDQQKKVALHLLAELSSIVGDELVKKLSEGPQKTESDFARVRLEIAALKEKLSHSTEPKATQLLALADSLLERSVWIMGGDGWAYDIGYGGLDHVLAMGRNVNILVLDTEVYSNTGGQASKATPRGAVAKFAAKGKPGMKKDLGQFAMAYGNVYVAQICLGSSPKQAIQAMLEAEAYPGTSLIIAYSTCIAHGINMTTSQTHQKDAVKSGFWPIYRFVPQVEDGETPFKLDCKKPTIPLREYAMQETRFSSLFRSKPELAEQLMQLAQKDVDERWRYYEQLATVKRTVPRI